MAVYHVIIDSGSNADKATERLKEAFADHYKYHDQERVWLVRTDDISETIAVKIGFKGDDNPDNSTGAVFKMNSNYAGYTKGAVWEWLSKND
jgi:hypothetical protein